MYIGKTAEYFQDLALNESCAVSTNYQNWNPVGFF